MQVIIKPIERCNAACIYCSVSPEKKKTQMSREIVEMVMKKFANYLKANNEEKVSFVWHGGEPLLLNYDFYKMVSLFQHQYFGENIDRVENTMQTNITLVTEKVAQIFKLMNITIVGTSYELLDDIRILRSSKSSYDYSKKFLQATEILNEHNVKWGIIYVVTKKALAEPKKIYRFLSNLISPNGSLRINAIYCEGSARKIQNYSITSQEYGHFMAEIFEDWIDNDGMLAKVDPLYSYYQKINRVPGHKKFTCDEGGRCSETHLGIDPDGKIYQCGRAMDSEVFLYGNIFENDISEIMSSPFKKQLAVRSQTLKQTEPSCSTCEYFDLCNAGCPVDAYIYNNKNMLSKTYWCEGRKIIFNKIASYCKN